MPEPIIGGLFALLIAIGGGSISYVLGLDRRLDALQVKIAEDYATKKELLRMDDKLDFIITEITHKEIK